MMSIGTQDIDSLQKKNISFEYLIGNISTLNAIPEEIIPPSPVLKRKRKISTRPTKKIKIATKTNYNFLDTQAQLLTPFSSGNNYKNHNIGVLGNSLTEFLNKKYEKKVHCKIIGIQNIYGVKLATVEITNSGIKNISGIMSMICTNPIIIGTSVMLIDPKIIELDHCIHILPKDIV